MANNNIELESQLQIVEQAIEFLSKVSVEHYQQVLKPHFTGSMGAHMRHILDHYIALQQGLSSHIVDYNRRHRDSDVALCPKSALQSWLQIKTWLIDVGRLETNLSLTIVCEISLTTSQNSQTTSTLGRELLFVASHAIHHFSLLLVMSSLQGKHCSPNFGLAPATASHLRQSA
ncbi:hypothetical protein [Paraglaciecola hydrolytica]|uniref:DinB-like domain-containing protein n=1 Tax=Paraglaciecola hydrolytica TaxID=1799789 RepID=A0A148KKM0_9ALTE|nr:hypothetical protein [Paraglaciecola hydrolytica]KXI26864.1 hypothetical protein AX660_03620 [Paraglaciecola hydrolytica]